MHADEVKRRISAARELRGLSQKELDELVHGDGLGKQEASRTERGDLPLTKVRREALSRHLRVPERWFLAETVDEIVGLADQPSVAVSDDDVTRAAEQLVPRLLEAARALAQGQAPEPRDEGEQGRPGRAAGGRGG